jgi:carnitine O-acetyltransferase
MDPKTFENQSKLPRLPIPSLQATLTRYQKSISPFCTPAELQDYSNKIVDFAKTLGPVLQERLIEYEKTQTNSWLEKWWLKLAYLT